LFVASPFSLGAIFLEFLSGGFEGFLFGGFALKFVLSASHRVPKARNSSWSFLLLFSQICFDLALLTFPFGIDVGIATF
jgi:hypothetical protein